VFDRPPLTNVKAAPRADIAKAMYAIDMYFANEVQVDRLGMGDLGEQNTAARDKISNALYE